MEDSHSKTNSGEIRIRGEGDMLQRFGTIMDRITEGISIIITETTIVVGHLTVTCNSLFRSPQNLN